MKGVELPLRCSAVPFASAVDSECKDEDVIDPARPAEASSGSASPGRARLWTQQDLLFRAPRCVLLPEVRSCVNTVPIVWGVCRCTVAIGGQGAAGLNAALLRSPPSGRCGVAGAGLRFISRSLSRVTVCAAAAGC